MKRTLPLPGRKASGEIGQNLLDWCGGQGIVRFAEALERANVVGQSWRSPWFCPICGVKALCAIEAFLP